MGETHKRGFSHTRLQKRSGVGLRSSNSAGDSHTDHRVVAGADAAATGENAVIFNAQRADVILGPVGIAFANSMMGEISPAMAAAVSSSRAKKLLIPMTRCQVQIMGITPAPLAAYIAEAVELLKSMPQNCP